MEALLILDALSYFDIMLVQPKPSTPSLHVRIYVTLSDAGVEIAWPQMERGKRESLEDVQPDPLVEATARSHPAQTQDNNSKWSGIVAGSIAQADLTICHT